MLLVPVGHVDLNIRVVVILASGRKTDIITDKRLYFPSLYSISVLCFLLLAELFSHETEQMMFCRSRTVPLSQQTRGDYNNDVFFE